MKDTIFVQFSVYREYGVEEPFYSLSNGFSDTWDFCKKHGDFVWIPEIKKSPREEDENPIKLPIKKGRAYVSLLTGPHIEKVVQAAKDYPEIEFIAGGPPIRFKWQGEHGIPANLTFFAGSVEDYFGIPNFSQEWKLEVPQDMKDTSIICYNYGIDSRCYWQKCNFCDFSELNCRIRPARMYDYKYLENVNHKGPKVIKIGTPALSPHLIKVFLPTLIPDNSLQYDVNLRFDEPSRLAFDSVISKMERIPNIRCQSGVEFPSNRMLQFMNKGHNVSDIFKMLEILQKHDSIKMNWSFIVGWPNLEEQDLVELKNFVASIPESSPNQIVTVFCLFVRKHGMPLSSSVWSPPNEKMYWRPIVGASEEIKKLNLEALDVIEKHFNLCDQYARDRILGL